MLLDIIEKDLPQLIVGLDSLNGSANYIHIEDAKENINYYCPCCKGLIKPMAYKKDIAYQVQPHFYHETGGCSDEIYIHYICKNWLFEKGCKFIVNNIQYEVKAIEIEKTLYTSFGDYRPDIIVTTTIDKVFYFEIKITNRKTELYAPKWDELENDVVEVDTRYFINQKYKNDIPEFNIIYSNGECFIKSYSRTDYEDTIAKRKLEWKRQDKLNYKIQWERLDWFWIDLQEYVNKREKTENVLKSFDKLEYNDKLWCYYTIKKKSCIDLKECFMNNINQHFYSMLHTLETDEIKISLAHVSPKIYHVTCRTEFSYLDYTLFEEEVIKVKLQKGGILPLDYKNEAEKCVSLLNTYITKGKNILKRIKHVGNLPYVKSIIPYSHWACGKYPLHTLDFTIKFQDYIHSKFLIEEIGNIRISANLIEENYIKGYFNKFRKEAFQDLEYEYIESCLKNDSKYQEIIKNISEICNNTSNFKLRVTAGGQDITLLDGYKMVRWHTFSTKTDLFGKFEEKIYNRFINYINLSIKKKKEEMDRKIGIEEIIQKYIALVNSCKNKYWRLQKAGDFYLELSFIDKDVSICNKFIRINFGGDVKDLDIQLKRKIYRAMKCIINESYYNFRIMEAR